MLGENDADDIYWKNEQKCRKLTKYMYYYIFVHQTMVMSAFFYSIYCICTGNLDTSTWMLPFIRVPTFNTNIIWTWYLECLTQLIMSIAYALAMVSPISYFLCCCFYIITGCNHFDLLLNSTRNDVDRIQKDKNLRKLQKLHHHLNKKLSQAVEVHGKVVE